MPNFFTHEEGRTESVQGKICLFLSLSMRITLTLRSLTSDNAKQKNP
jgi:hypothetical protein